MELPQQEGHLYLFPKYFIFDWFSFISGFVLLFSLCSRKLLPNEHITLSPLSSSTSSSVCVSMCKEDVVFPFLPAMSYLLLLPLCISNSHRRMQRKLDLGNLSTMLYVSVQGIFHPNDLCRFPSPNPNCIFISDHLDLDW